MCCWDNCELIICIEVRGNVAKLQVGQSGGLDLGKLGQDRKFFEARGASNALYAVCGTGGAHREVGCSKEGGMITGGREMAADGEEIVHTGGKALAEKKKGW